MEKAIFGLIFLVFLAWIFVRVVAFLRVALKPVRDVVEPHAKVVDDHLKDSLRKSGLGGIADFGDRLQRGINQAVDNVQRGVDERNKK